MAGPALSITFGDLTGPSVTFGPITQQKVGFLGGPVTISSPTHQSRLGARSGIEPLTLSYLRADLLDLHTNRAGSLTFGDHDFNEIVKVEGNSDRGVRISANNPVIDAWEIGIGHFPWESIAGTVSQINAIDDRFGPLESHCGCGRPGRTYQAGPGQAVRP